MTDRILNFFYFLFVVAAMVVIFDGFLFWR